MRTTDKKSVVQPYRHIPPSQFKEAKYHIYNLLCKGIIEESNSPYTSPIIIGWKKNRDIRLCVDYKNLN